MTSISCSTSTPMPFVQRTLQRDVATGSIPATDETALTAAIGDIATQLQGGATAATATTAGASSTATAPTSIKDRVDSMIDEQISSGKLTADQGSELKGVFAQAHAHMHGAHGHHGGGGGGGIDGLLASLTSQSSTDPATTDAVTTAGATSSTAATSTSPASTLATSATTAVAAIEAFLNQFKAAIASNGTYSANGQASSSPLSVLVNSVG